MIKMKKIKENYFAIIWKGIKIGLNLPSLLKSIATFHNYPLIRILRVLGSISIVLFLSSSKYIESSFLYLGIFLFINVTVHLYLNNKYY